MKERTLVLAQHNGGAGRNPFAAPDRRDAASGRPPRVAILDDDEAVRTAVGMLVESMGWQSAPVSTVEEFMKEMDLANIECLVLDLQMPNIDGAQLLEMLRGLDILLPVIVITAFPDESLADRARAAGVHKVFGKPFNADELVEAISETLA